jgi:hypothetical protein
MVKPLKTGQLLAEGFTLSGPLEPIGMTFDPAVVDAAVERLKNCEQTAHLGKPVKILLCSGEDEGPFAMFGVGVEFTGEVRNAVAFSGPLAADNYAETKRKIEEWIAS